MCLKEKIRDKYGSIAAFAREIKKSRGAVYLALNDHPHMKVLKSEILKLLGEK